MMRGENQSTWVKTSQSRVENQQTQSAYDAKCGNITRATLVEGKYSHQFESTVICLLNRYCCLNSNYFVF